MRNRILDLYWKKMDPDPGHNRFLQIYWICLTRQNCQNILTVHILVLRIKTPFFCSFWLIFLPLDPDSWISYFSDPDLGSQNLADPTDPKHCVNRGEESTTISSLSHILLIFSSEPPRNPRPIIMCFKVSNFFPLLFTLPSFFFFFLNYFVICVMYLLFVNFKK